MIKVHLVRTGVLETAYERHGDPDGWPVVLLHGFPYDVRAYDEVAPRLADAGAAWSCPTCAATGRRGSSTPDTLRSGSRRRSARDLLDAPRRARPRRGRCSAGYDWGGRAACIVAALWPERVRGLVTCGGYNIQDIAEPPDPAAPEPSIGSGTSTTSTANAAGPVSSANRAEFARLLWRLWSPAWRFDDATFDARAAPFDNPDFVDVVVHSYRHRFGLVAGDPAYEGSRSRPPSRGSPCRRWCSTPSTTRSTRRPAPTSTTGASPGSSTTGWCPADTTSHRSAPASSSAALLSLRVTVHR